MSSCLVPECRESPTPTPPQPPPPHHHHNNNPTITIITTLFSAQPTWFGFRPTAGKPGSVDLVELTDKAVVTNVVGSVVFGNSKEYAWPNAVRCLPGPPAFCLLATTIADAASSTGNTSFVYSVSSKDAKIIYRTECPGASGRSRLSGHRELTPSPPTRAGVCNQMHVDFSSGTAYTFSFEGPGGSRAEVVSVTAAGAVQVADITTAVAGGDVRPGQTTHCSATKHMYVGVDHGGAGKDQILAVDLTRGAVDATVTLQVPLFAALWATCDGSGIIGGVSFETSAAGEASFGTVDAKGAYTPKSKVQVTPGLVPSGLLTATSPQVCARPR